MSVLIPTIHSGTQFMGPTKHWHSRIFSLNPCCSPEHWHTGFSVLVPVKIILMWTAKNGHPRIFCTNSIYPPRGDTAEDWQNLILCSNTSYLMRDTAEQWHVPIPAGHNTAEHWHSLQQSIQEHSWPLAFLVWIPAIHPWTQRALTSQDFLSWSHLSN